MSQRRPAQTVVPFRPRPADFERAVRAAATDSGKVAFTRHARERMIERGLSDRQALFVLRQGYLSGEIKAGSKLGEWKCKMVARIKGNRDAGVVTVMLQAGTLVVLTVEWEDL